MTSQSMTSLKEVLDERESFRSQLVAMQSQIEVTSDQFGPNVLFGFDVPNVLAKMEEYKVSLLASTAGSMLFQLQNISIFIRSDPEITKDPTRPPLSTDIFLPELF